MTTASVLLEVRSTAIARWETIIYRATISEWGGDRQPVGWTRRKTVLILPLLPG